LANHLTLLKNCLRIFLETVFNFDNSEFSLLKAVMTTLGQARKHPQEGGTPVGRLSQSENAESTNKKW